MLTSNMTETRTTEFKVSAHHTRNVSPLAAKFVCVTLKLIFTLLNDKEGRTKSQMMRILVSIECHLLHQPYGAKHCLLGLDRNPGLQANKLVRHACNCQHNNDFEWILNNVHVKTGRVRVVHDSIGPQLASPPIKSNSSAKQTYGKSTRI